MFSPDCYESKRIVDLFFIAGLTEEDILEFLKVKVLPDNNSLLPRILFKYPPDNLNLTEEHMPVSFFI